MLKVKECFFCKNKKFRTLFYSKDRMFGLTGEFVVKKCKCGLIFLDPMPDEATLKKYYPSHKYYAYAAEKNESLFSNLREYLIRHYYKKNIISRIIAILIHDVPAIPTWRRDGKILDVGSGTGETLILLKKQGWNVYGLDIDKNALKIARKRGIENLTQGTYKSINSFPDNYFDAIRMYHVIEHLDNPILALRIIYRKLKKNGEIIIGTPNTKSVTAKLFGKYWLNLDTPRHVILFDPDILKKLLLKEGYKITEVDFCSGGGIVGSLGYLLSDLSGKRVNVLGNIFFIMFFYPLEWIFDKLKLGDIFVIKARK